MQEVTQTLSVSEALGDRIKGYESKFTGPRIDPSLPFVMRLDGHGFSRFTRGLKKPYDYNFHQAFLNTTMQLMREYQADTGYTHSDEISLLFYPKRTKDDSGWREPHFGGRIQKVISTAAAYCTMIFNNELKTIFAQKKDEYVDKEYVYDRMMSGTAYFDCRIFQVPNEAEMFSYMYWRSKVDCHRNHVFDLARRFYPKKELEGVNSGEKIKMLLEKGVDWEKEPACFKHGSFIKRVPKILEGNEEAIRFEFKEVDVDLTKFNDEINEYLKCSVYQKVLN